MNRQSKRSGRDNGHIIWELLLVLFISSQISITGFHLLQKIMRAHRTNLNHNQQYANFQATLDQLQDAFDRRYTNPLSTIPWLLIETGSGSDWVALQKMQILIVRNGEIVPWDWEMPEGWIVQINQPGNAWHAGEFPHELAIRFPHAIFADFRHGIAIEEI